MPRDRAQTEQRLIDAVGQLIAEQGIDQVGINRVAKRAGVNKILIYRYFGGLDGLMQAYVRQTKPIINTPGLNVEQLRTASLEEFFDACADYMISEYRQLRNNIEAQEFLRADLLRQDDVHDAISMEKERQFREMIDNMAAIVNSPNGRAFAAILTSGMTLLTFLSQQKKTVLGLNLGDDASWQQIETALRRIYRGAMLIIREDRLNQETAPVSADGLSTERP